MHRAEELARRLLTDLAEERQRLARAEQRVDETRRTIGRLKERLAPDAAPELLDQLERQMAAVHTDCVRDRTERLRQWRLLVEALRDRLGRMGDLAALGELSASVAHEIRNPLCGMMLSVEVLQTKMDPEDSRMRVLRNLHREAEKMEKVVNNLLHYARQYKPRLVPCELEEVIRKTIESIRAHLDRKRIEVSIVRSPAECRADADPEMLQQVFRNILLNSVDASTEGSHLQVGLRMPGDPPQVAVTFRDQGEGIEPDRLERIFEPFFTSKHNGVGLGLSVSKKIVDAHEGCIEVESEPGAGTTFTVVLPARAEPQSERAAA
ncbi:MAG: ATP-binding protein [Candidatus Brocadiia bacterium]